MIDKIIYLCLCLLFISCFPTSTLEKEKELCNILNVIFKEEQVINDCHFNRNSLDTIYIVDTTKTFSECEFVHIGKTFIITQREISEEIFDKKRGRLRFKSKDLVTVFKVKNIGDNRYEIKLIRESGGNIINCLFFYNEEKVELEKLTIFHK